MIWGYHHVWKHPYRFQCRFHVGRFANFFLVDVAPLVSMHFCTTLSIRQLRRSCCWWTTSCNQLGCVKLYQTLDHGRSSISTRHTYNWVQDFVHQQSVMLFTIATNYQNQQEGAQKQGSLYHQPNNALRGNPSKLPYVCIVSIPLPNKNGKSNDA